MNVTWEMIAGLVAILVAMFGGFKWIAAKFDKLAANIGKIDKKKVSHKTCRQRRDECPCRSEITNKRKD